ncbi:MAG: hypothetical protein AAGF01_03565 [Cyanobacteria bacterium P01_G01_bin.38]
MGTYCKDEALETLRISRSESFELPSCWSCVLGLDLDHPRAAEFLQTWKEKAADRITFPGPKWSGAYGWPKIASQDPRGKGHRHDQTAASVIAYKLGMKDWKTKELFDEFFENDRYFVRRYQERYQNMTSHQIRRFGKRFILLGGKQWARNFFRMMGGLSKRRVFRQVD